MGKRFSRIWDVPLSGSAAVLVILSVAFLLGGLTGCLLVNQVGGEGGEALADYLDFFLEACSSGASEKPQLLFCVRDTFRWPLIVLLLGLTPIGLLGIPAVFLVRGFLISFAVSSLFRAIGMTGLGLAFAVFGISGLISVPSLFVLGVHSFLLAGSVTGRLLGESHRTALFERPALLRCGVCAAMLCVCIFIECYVIPVFLESFAGGVLG